MVYNARLLTGIELTSQEIKMLADEDVVHAVMTDHYIQRRKPDRDLLRQIAERHETNRNAYHGDVVLYYPEELARAPENELYLAIAQVSQSSNLSRGIALLTSAIDKYRPL